MLNLFKPHIPAFGLQLNGTSLKVMQLVHSGSKVHVRGYSHVPLPKNVMLNDAIVDPKALASLISETVKKPGYGSINTRYVAVSLPETKSFVRVITLPKMNESEVENAILFEAEGYIPLPIDQVYFDWQVIRQTPNSTDVLVIASQKDTVDKYVETAEAAGLRVMEIEVESQSLARALLPHASKETVLIVDIDSFKTNLAMVTRGKLQFSSSIPIAGNTINERIAQALGISSQKADMIKKQIGFVNTPEYPNLKTILLPVLNNLVEEVKNILKFYHEHSEQPVERVLLSGGNATTENLAAYLTESLAEFNSIKVELADPWVRVPNLAKSPLPYNEALTFTAAIGLAQRAMIGTL